MRQIILDTETTGIEPSEGHRIIEIGCVEMINRRLTGNNFHVYLNPDRVVDDGAVEVHGITNEMLADKPRFAEVVDDFLEYVKGAELVIHNAPFDVGFLNHEMNLLNAGHGKVEDHCKILDTLTMARQMHPGQKNSLDALCKRYGIDNAHRELHGALLDSEILADVYLAMTGGQVSLSLSSHQERMAGGKPGEIRRLSPKRGPVVVLKATDEELAAHQERLAAVEKASGAAPLWQQLEEPTAVH